MPTRSDITVVNSAYTTSASARPVRLSNGNLVSAMVNGANYYLYKSTDNGATWSLLYSDTATTVTGISLVARQTDVYLMLGINNANIYVTRVNGLTGSAYTTQTPDTSQTAFSGISLTINETGTELHAAWSSKNSTYPNSFNIRYAKGTISALDGSVTWGTVTQVTINNTASQDFVNPSIVLNKNNYPVIAATFQLQMRVLQFDGTTWNIRTLADIGYQQSSPSAIFVPQSINGLANGRIWVAWHGLDATDTTIENIRVSYSDDGGITWSAMQKLTSGNTLRQQSPSITASKDGKLYIVFNGSDGTYWQVRRLDYNGTSWGSYSTVTNITVANSSALPLPSTLFDLTMNISSPLYIYRNTSKVGFYGTWVITTNSVPEGSIGTKSSVDMGNFLTYTITSDGTMTTVTEKLNGVVIGTKTPTSGQSNVVVLSQSQWDNIKYSKYKDSTGGLNTLTVEMGSDVWTYTFDKRSSSLDAPEQVIQAENDANTIMFPSVKTKLANSIVSRGSTMNVTGSDSFDTLNSAINTLGRMPIIGTATSSSSTSVFAYPNGSTNSSYYLSVTGLPAKPTFIYVFWVNGSSTTTSVYSELAGDQYPKTVKVTQSFSNSSSSGSTWHYKADVAPASVINGSFTIPVYNSNVSYTYIAYFD